MPLSSLEIGKRALQAQRLGLEITSNNIGNVNTPGFSRREATFSEADPLIKNGNFLGTGVINEKMRTFREEFFDKEIRRSISRNIGYETDERLVQRIEAILAEPTENGLSEVVSGFLYDFDEISLKPESVAHRELVLSNAKGVVDQFRRTAVQLNETRNEVRNNISDAIDRANKLIGNITGINTSIGSTKVIAGTEVQSLLDKREVMLEELSELGVVTVTQNDDGSLNAFMNGKNLITGQTRNELKLQEDINTATGERTIRIVTISANNVITGSVNPEAGKLSSLLKHYNITLDDKDSTDEFSVSQNLNDFANALVQKVNELTIAGFGLNDTGQVPPGRFFFEPAVGDATAMTIEISADVKNKPSDIPLSAKGGQPGDSTVARQIARLADDADFLHGQKPAEFYASFLGKIGNLGNDAINGSKTTKLVLDQLTNQREAVIGVNLDEEAINLIKFQKAFEASARIIAITNEILGTIVNLGR